MGTETEPILGDVKPNTNVGRALNKLLTGEPAELKPGDAVPAAALRRVCLAASESGSIGRIFLTGGRIVGSFDLTGLRLDVALRFVGTTFEETIVLTDTRLLALELEGGSAPGGIKAGRLEVAHDMVVNKGFRSGRVWLPSATIGGDMNFGGACLDLAGDGQPSLLFDGARVHGRVYLNKQGTKFKANHGAYGQNARIAGGMLCTDGIFNDELNLRRAQIQGELSLKDAVIQGHLILEATHVTNDLRLEGTILNGSKALLTRARVGGSLVWRITRHARNKGGLEVSLEQAQVRFLDDELASWKGTDRKLDGFAFAGVNVSKLTREWIRGRKRWLNCRRDDWSAYPYDQLSAALRSSGHEAAARKIAIARETRRREHGGLNRLQRTWSRIYGATLAHGYEPVRFYAVAIVTMALGAGVFATRDTCTPEPGRTSCGDFVVPADDAPPFRWPQFSLDAFLPVDLGQTSAWQLADGWAYLVSVETILGWLFTGVLIAAVTGVLRKD
jgi:hypothetical protein